MKRKRSSAVTESQASNSALIPTCPFDLLNDDLLVRVFQFLGSGIDCLTSLARICKRFRRLLKSPSLWESKIYIGPGALSKFPPQLSQYPVKTIFFWIHSKNWLGLVKPLLSLKGTLQSLVIDYADNSLPVSLLIGNLTGLTSLSLRNVGMSGRTLYNFSQRQIFDFQDALTELKGLKDLSLTRIPINHDTLQKVLSQCPLVSLTLAFFDKSLKVEYNLKELMFAVSTASQMTHLTLNAVLNDWTHTVETSSSLTSLKGLRTLDVQDSELTISCFAIWIRSFPCLTSCNIDSLIVDENGNNTHSLKECTQTIEQLSIGQMDHIIVESVSEWIQRLSSLTKLSVCFVQFLETLNATQNQLPCLISLDLTLSLDISKSQRLSYQALTGIASLARLSKLSIQLVYEDGVSFEGDDLSVRGLRRLQNLQHLRLHLGGVLADSPGEHDEDALTVMLECALPRCVIFVEVDNRYR
mmetsp:Transcript_34472/g.55770  ORF Transcript_34472/g.55770 Transcript_34472/m.55770 type:complete len:469 (-) Transcript_34472:274-1680(-)|eukprot:CAMPEP_0184658280 /NCGR_PEP_ID=MMETSP0308-20130426/24601_1 /TAXON_ID=38269 /ORGANISM="Gloeochaete witrockiana, Strain SAG 46.84" /LENGTH=468 /DNA_ID=CAMNT_0027097145 /DNA_START=131 /DNA_END=1537 /DNA_ORIENTATION=-